MNELDAFEKSIKTELEGFDQVKPSKMLWFKISMTLWFKWLTGSRVLLSSIIGLLVLFSLGWLFSTDVVFSTANTSQIQKSSSQKQLEFAQSSTLSNIDDIENTEKTIGNSKILAQDNSTKNNNLPTKDNQTKNSNVSTPNMTNKSDQGLETADNISTIPNYASTQEKTPNQNSPVNYELPSTMDVEMTMQKQRELETIMKWKLLPYLPHLNASFPISNYCVPTTSYLRPIWMEYEIYIGPGLTQSEFVFTADQTPAKSLTTSYHTGGSLIANYEQWFVRSGLEYNKISQEFPYASNVIIFDSSTYFYTVFNNTYVYDTLDWIYNVGGLDSIPVIGLTTIQTQSQESYMVVDSSQKTLNEKFRNSYSTVSVPLMIGRKFELNGFVFDVAAGVNWTHIASAEAWVLDSKTNQIIKIDQSSKLINREFLSGVVGIGMGYRFKENGLLFIRPQFQYNLNSIIDKSYSANQRLYQYRISAGLRFTLN